MSAFTEKELAALSDGLIKYSHSVHKYMDIKADPKFAGALKSRTPKMLGHQASKSIQAHVMKYGDSCWELLGGLVYGSLRTYPSRGCRELHDTYDGARLRYIEQWEAMRADEADSDVDDDDGMFRSSSYEGLSQEEIHKKVAEFEHEVVQCQREYSRLQREYSDLSQE